MPTPGFDDPALASLPPGGNLYYGADVAVGQKLPASEYFATPRGPGHAQARDLNAPPLIFGTGSATDGEGAQIVHAGASSRGHWSEVLNFHGSPAPWILLGILLAAGLLHMSANARFKGQL